MSILLSKALMWGEKNLAGAWNLLPSHPHPSGLLYRFHGTRTLPPHEGVTCFDLCLWLHSTPDGMGLTWNLSPSLPEPAQSGPPAQPVPAPHRLPFNPHWFAMAAGNQSPLNVHIYSHHHCHSTEGHPEALLTLQLRISLPQHRGSLLVIWKNKS